VTAIVSSLQGSNQCSSKKQTRANLLLTTSAVIDSVIISNAYKGDNINKINSPLREEVHDSLEESSFKTQFQHIQLNHEENNEIGYGLPG